MTEIIPFPSLHRPAAEASVPSHPVSKLVTGIAHEVRNPLGVLLMGIDCLESKLRGDALAMKVIEDMRNAIARTDSIVSALPDVSPANRRPRHPANFNQLVESALRQINPDAEGRGIAVVRDFAAELPDVSLDAKKFQQAVLHLLNNALEAMPGGGTLTLQTLHHLPLESAEGGNFVGLRITDTGGGVPAHLLGKVFEPFFSADKTERNAGLGLTVAREIIHAHGGTIAIARGEVGGTVVSVTLAGSGVGSESIAPQPAVVRPELVTN